SGVVGRDEAAENLKTTLTAANILADFHHSADKPTITKLRVISRHQQLIRMDMEERYSEADSKACLDRTEALLKSAGALVLSDYNKGSLWDVQGFIQLARQHSLPVLVDPKGSDFNRYRGATLLTPNLHEFEAVVGHCENEQVLVSRGHALIDELDLQALLITRGEHGMTLLVPGHPELHLPARAREVFDVTGAGDTVIAVLAAALAAGESY